MSDRTAALERALAFDEPIVCHGEVPIDGELELRFADGTVLALGDGDFVERLVERCELAPFGDAVRTRTDARVRSGLRAVDRGRIRVEGFDPRTVLDEVRAALAPNRQVEAVLTDVLVYPRDGHFAAHRDTPMDADMLGTLVVALPIAFEGGDLVLDDGGGPVRVPTRPKKRRLAWAAFHGDVEHSVEPVRTGHRVTLTYRLSLGKRVVPKIDRAEPLRAALTEALADPDWMARGALLLVPCARRVIAPAKTQRAMHVEQLRGADCDVAAALHDAGLEPTVCPCIVASSEKRKKDRWFDEGVADYATLRRELSAEDAAFDECVTFAKEATSDEEEIDATSLARVIETDRFIEVLARRRAQCTLVAEATFSATGYFGNEYYDAFLYTFVALRVDVPSAEARGVAPVESAPVVVLPRVRHPKFGEGEVLREEGSGDGATVVVRFATGEKKLLKRFVTPA